MAHGLLRRCCEGYYVPDLVGLKYDGSQHVEYFGGGYEETGLNFGKRNVFGYI